MWKFGDGVGVDSFISTKYDPMIVAQRFEELAAHVLEDIDPSFVQTVQKGDVIVAGRRFGVGKHHIGAIGAMRHLGISAFLAESMHPVFQREAINHGILALACKVLPGKVNSGDLLQADFRTGEARNLTTNQVIEEAPASDILMSIVDAGGLEQWTLDRLGEARRAPSSSRDSRLDRGRLSS